MNKLLISPGLLIFLPAISLVPVSYELYNNLHLGGLNTIRIFLLAALTPSLDAKVIQSSISAIIVTISVALIGWATSLLTGSFLGLISSNTFWRTLGLSGKYAGFLKLLLCIPRSIHEIVWGLILLQIFGLSGWIAIIAICIPSSCLISKVVRDQIDNLNPKPLNSIISSGSSACSAIVTSIIPPILPIISSYGAYQLECSLRAATLLGVFGLGGIGTEIKLTFLSLEFNEMWTSLWILGGVSMTLEFLLNYIRKSNKGTDKIFKNLGANISIISLSIASSLMYLDKIDIGFLDPLRWQPIQLPNIDQILYAFDGLELVNLISSTILITFLAAGIAIGGPPIAMCILPTKLSIKLQSFAWSIFRLTPPPLLVFLLMLCIKPCISVSALALGINSFGVMARLLKEKIDIQDSSIYQGLKASASALRPSWLYGFLIPNSRSYLAYASYRLDVIFRETAIVGAAGGMGLGWQLRESLSSFAWGEVLIVTTTYVCISLIGERIADKMQQYWLNPELTDGQIGFQT